MSRNRSPKHPGQSTEGWTWPVDLGRYDRNEELSTAENRALDIVSRDQKYNRRGFVHDALPDLERLLIPVYDVFDFTGAGKELRRRTKNALLREMNCRRTAYWAWSHDEWLESLNGESQAARQLRSTVTTN